MKRVSFTLNDEHVEVDAGTTILDAAANRGIFIPTFCHTRELTPQPSCSICVVEIEGESDLVPSCSTTVAPGMVVLTETDRVKAARRTCVELLLSDHVGDCQGPCRNACPAGIDIPGFISHIARGEDGEALKLIRHSMPLAGSLGRICDRPCEEDCRRQLVEQPVAICQLKRFAADAVPNTDEAYLPKKQPGTGKKVAVVGAGPAGLTVAYFLQILGHACTILDAREKPGGMLRYGVPQFRLPHAIIEREAAVIEKLGAEFRCGMRIGRDITVEELGSQFDAVFLGLGAQEPQRLNVEGEDAPGVISGIDFLQNQDGDEKALAGKRVIVVGGGNVAMDAARVALRQGAQVHVYCLETREEMPAKSTDLEEALAEGIEVTNERGVKRIVAEQNRVNAVELMRCVTVFDENGKFAPRFDESDSNVTECDTLIVAIGQQTDLSGLEQESSIAKQIGDRVLPAGARALSVDEHTHQTGMKNVFAGGDCVTGAGRAVQAVAAGRRAALAIDQYLLHREVVGMPFTYNHTMGDLDAVPQKAVEQFAAKDRAETPQLDPRNRAANFDEIEAGFTTEQAREEAKRCIECGCRAVLDCRLRSYATLFEVDGSKFQGRCREYSLDESHPKIVYAEHKCIQCRTCVRLTEKLLGSAAMEVVGRGFSARVQPASSREMALVDDQGLALIVDSCPVGALTFKDAPVAAPDALFKRSATG